MARKRLSDLLREESQKSPESENVQPENQPENQPEREKEDDRPSSSLTPDLESEAEEIHASPMKTSTPAPHNRRTTPTKAELDALVTELKAALETDRQTAQNTENTLQQKIASLESELQTQQKLIQTLQADVQQAQPLKAELEEAKKVILQLSKMNAKPFPPAESVVVSPTTKLVGQPVQTIRQLESQPRVQRNVQSNARTPDVRTNMQPRIQPSLQAAEPELEPSVSGAIASDSTKEMRRDRPSAHQAALRQILGHPTQPGSLPAMPSEQSEKKESKLSDPDMGWVD